MKQGCCTGPVVIPQKLTGATGRPLQLARAIPSPWDEAHALAGMGRCAMATGDTIQAQLLLRQAEEIFLRIGAAEAHAVRAEYDDAVKPGAGE